MVRQCRVYRSFDVDSDHFPVLATLKLKLKRSTQPQTKHFIPNLSSFSNIDVSREYAANVSSKLKATSLEDQTLETMWGHYKCSQFCCKRGSWKTSVCQETMNIPGYSCYYWSAQASYSKGRCRGIRLAGPRRRSLRHDKQQRMEQVVRTGENHLLCGEIKDAFASFRQLKQKCATSAPLKALDGKLLSDRASVAARWQDDDDLKGRHQVFRFHICWCLCLDRGNKLAVCRHQGPDSQKFLRFS